MKPVFDRARNDNPMNYVERVLDDKSATLNDLAHLPLGARIAYESPGDSCIFRLIASDGSNLTFVNENTPERTFDGQAVLDKLLDFGDTRVLGCVPVEGSPVTFCIGSDRYAHKVVKVVYAKNVVPLCSFPRLIVLENGEEYSARKAYTVFEAKFAPVRYIRRGDTRGSGSLYIGHGEEYRDPSF